MNKIVYMAVICISVGYFVGNINPSYIISRMKGFDIRTKGTGNAGASNTMIILGKSVGVLCALLDILKAYLTVKIMGHLFPILKIAGLLAGVACILGHILPILMGFQGGKGLACLGGVILAYNSKLLLKLLLLEFIIALVTRYICTVATSASLIFTIILFTNEGLLYALIFVPVVIAIWMKHRINFIRIRYGVEAKFSYLWNKEAEEERVRCNWNKLTQSERILVALPDPQ